MPWKSRTNAKLKRQHDELATRLLKVREELQTSERYRTGLEVVLTERLARIDELNGKLDQLRAQNRKLDKENDRLAEMVRFAPPGDAAIAAPK